MRYQIQHKLADCHQQVELVAQFHLKTYSCLAAVDGERLHKQKPRRHFFRLRFGRCVSDVWVVFFSFSFF